MGIFGKYKHHLPLGGMAASMALYVFVISRWGFGTSPDSVMYIAGARHIAAGRGYTLPLIAGDAAPIVHFPPLFSAALSLFELFGIDSLEGAALLNATLLAVNVYFAGLLVYRASGSAAAGYIAAALIGTAPAILTIHTMVWSEALSVFLLIITAFTVARYLEAPSWSSLLWVLPAALLAPLARYAGMAVVIAAAVTIARRGMYKHAAACGIASSLGLAAWLARNYILATDLTGHGVIFHAPTWGNIVVGSQTVLEWFGGLLLAMTFAGLIVFTFIRRRLDLARGRSFFLPNFAMVYAAVLALTLLFVDAQTPLDRRILSPLYVVLCLYAVIWIATKAGQPLRLVWAGLAVMVITLNSWTSKSWLNELSAQGIGLSSSKWRHSPTMNYLRTHSATPLYTNAPDPVFLVLGALASMLPRHTEPRTLVANQKYPAQMEQLAKNGGIIVYFHEFAWRWYLPAEDRLHVELRLVRIASFPDATVYAITPTSE